MANRWQKQWKQWLTLSFWALKITADGDCSHEIKRCLVLGRKAVNHLGSTLKSRDITNKDLFSQSYDFSSSHVRMWELDHKESWASKNWCFWTVVLEKTLDSPLDSKESIQPSNPLSSPSPPAFNLSHQRLFQWVRSSHQVAKVLEFQLQHQSFQWIFRTDLL